MRLFLFFILATFTIYAQNPTISINTTSKITKSKKIHKKNNVKSSNNRQSNEHTNTIIQNEVLKSKINSPYSSLEKIFPNAYLEGVLLGFIQSVENTLLKIDIRRISLEFSNTTIQAPNEYKNLQITQFNGDNSTIVNFKADLGLDYNFEDSRFSNNLIVNYGLIVLTPRGLPSTRTETADDLSLTSGYTKKVFILENGFVGPFIDGQYQTELTRNLDANNNLLPLSQTLRYKVGMKMLDGKYIDEIYLAGVGEMDLTYSPMGINGALEVGLRAKSPITNDIKLVYQGFYRHYIGFNIKRDTDILYNLNLNMRVDVSVYNGFALSPFISAQFAKIRGSRKNGSNITTGVALLYSTSINAISSIQSSQNAQFQQYYKPIK